MRRSIPFFGWFLFSISSITLAQEYPARVVVHAEHQGGDIVYRYEVRNNGPAEIKRVAIGCDCRALPGVLPELQVVPGTARAVRRDEASLWYELSADAAVQPPGWRVRLARPQGASQYWIDWTMPSARAGSGIGAQRSLAGFSITVPGADDAFLSGTYTIWTETGAVTSAPLALADTTPPTLSLETRATSGEPGVTAAVRVVATATDDHDPEPEIVLESVGRSDNANGPGYTLVYSATDASGNRSTATARVPLPTGEVRPAAPANPVIEPAHRLPKVVSGPSAAPVMAASVCLGDC